VRWRGVGGRQKTTLFMGLEKGVKEEAKESKASKEEKKKQAKGKK
jgi:hypothetical protein